MIFSKMGIPIRPPMALNIEVTNRCNAMCVMCPRDKMTREQGIMPHALFTKIIDEAKNLKIRKAHLFNFGEPLLDPLLAEKVAYAEQNGLRTHFVTNGYLLNKETARKLILAGLSNIKISISGLDNAIYESIHRGLNLKVVEENTLNFIALRKELGSKSPQIEVQLMLCKETVKQTKEYYKKWRYLADKIILSTPSNFGGGREYIPYDKYRMKICSFPFRMMIILWNGDAVTCCNDYNGCLKMGNLYQENLQEIWLGKNYRQLRKTVLGRIRYSNTLCLSCRRNRNMPYSREKQMCMETSIFDTNKHPAIE